MPKYYEKIINEFSNLDFGNAYDKHQRDNADESSFITKIKKNFLNTDFEKRIELINSFRYVFDIEIGELNKLEILNFLDIYKVFGSNFAEDQIKPLFRTINRSYLHDTAFVNLLFNHFQNSKMIMVDCFLSDNELYNNVYLKYKPIKQYIDGLMISNIHNIYTHEVDRFCKESTLWSDYYDEVLNNIEFNNEILNSIFVYYSQAKGGYDWFDTFLEVFSKTENFQKFEITEQTMNSYINLCIEFLMSNFNTDGVIKSTKQNIINLTNKSLCFDKSILKHYYNTRLKYLIQINHIISEQFLNNIEELDDLNNINFENLEMNTNYYQDCYVEDEDEIYSNTIKDLTDIVSKLIKTTTNGYTMIRPVTLKLSKLHFALFTDIDNMIQRVNNNTHHEDETIRLLLSNKNKFKNIINYSKIAN